MTPPTDSEQYLKRKSFYNKVLTVYGRKPVLEAIQNSEIDCYRLHLAENNKSAEILKQILDLAQKRDIETIYHSREELSRISKNRKQDQGIALDLLCPAHQSLDEFIDQQTEPFTLLAIDGVNNPQNLGMIIRSVAASPINGLLLAQQGNSSIGPLVIKASAGTVFSCPIISCNKLLPSLKKLAQADICVLTGAANEELKNFQPKGSVVYVLGNETSGVSKEVMNISTRKVKIPMNHGIESLNVAVTAALIAFRSCL